MTGDILTSTQGSALASTGSAVSIDGLGLLVADTNTYLAIISFLLAFLAGLFIQQIIWRRMNR